MLKRSDGWYIKNINPYQKLIPHIMPQRYDSMNMTTVEFRWKFIEVFLAQTRAEGKNYNYMDVLMTGLVRLFAKRPSLNRFVMRKRIYQHNDITVSFVVKKRLVDNSEDTTVKLHFTGEESLDDVHNALEKIIAENTGSEVFNRVDKTATVLTNAWHGLISFAIWMFRFLDNRNLLPKSIIETSPFHNSMFITFLKSINGDWIFHHCYEFGTTGIFLAFGKEREQAISINGEVVSEKILPMGVCVDERFCDGLYFVNSMRLLRKIMENPSCLLSRCVIENTVENGVRTDKDKEQYKRLSKEAKIKKKLAKSAKKEVASTKTE